jgi:hypothetical protein
MTLADLYKLVETAQWFSRLGGGVATSEVVAVTDHEAWRRYFSASTGAEFMLPHDEAALTNQVLGRMTWLPTTATQEDPIHGDRLSVTAAERGETANLRAARLQVTRFLLKSLRPVEKPPLLQVGPTNLEGAARGAAQYAFRQAAVEVLLQCEGFWCSVAQIYHIGNWPMGRLPDGRLVIL